MSGRQEELIAGWLDGSLAEAEQAELLEALRADAALARAFAGELEIHRGLQFSASQSAAGDRRAAERILHYVRASREETTFAERVRRRAGRVSPKPAASTGPLIAAAAALVFAALVGLLAYSAREKPEAPVSVEGTPSHTPGLLPDSNPGRPRPEPARESEEDRRKRIEEELRVASEKHEAPPKPKDAPAPAPEEKPVVREPKPEPPAKPEITKVEAIPALARLEGVQGDVLLGSDRTPAASGAELRDGAALETAGLAIVRFADGTRVEITGEAKLHEKLAGKRASGKGVTLARGTITAEVAKQPAGQALLFVTPHAEVQVIGTRLSIQSGAETRVDVHEGQVRLTSLKSGQPFTVSAGQGIDVGPAGAPRPFLLGLHAVYFDQSTFKGPAVERVDAAVDLFLDQAKNEIPPVGTDRNFGVRWDGRFLAETAGEYVFILSVDGQVHFVLDGQDLVADPRGVFHPIARSVVRRKLTAGWHDLLIEYADDQGSSRCGLRYVPPGDVLQGDGSGFAIPPRLFTHIRR